MNKVTVRKQELVDIVKKNRDAHRKIFEEAIDVYRSRLLDELERRIDNVKNNRKIDHMIRLPIPEDHTEDYDRVLQMLSMEVGDEVTIDAQSFAQFVRDDWDWKDRFFANTVSYTAAAANS